VIAPSHPGRVLPMTGTVTSTLGDVVRIAWTDGTTGPAYRPARDLAVGDRVLVVAGRMVRRPTATTTDSQQESR
jgi:hypothetical protein